ncbi:hypothetical protein B0H13DRAFT_2364293 [Mycena leptocephala]|nr:hypothetical protein B0H13DRAFT_2364293 [Mycena leptocephala]
MTRGRVSKFSPEQLLFLVNDYYPNFAKAQCESRLPKFWTKVENAFFERWPENEAQGIVIPEDDGTAEGEVPGLSEEDRKALGEAEKERKKLGLWAC